MCYSSDLSERKVVEARDCRNHAHAGITSESVSEVSTSLPATLCTSLTGPDSPAFRKAVADARAPGIALTVSDGIGVSLVLVAGHDGKLASSASRAVLSFFLNTVSGNGYYLKLTRDPFS